MVSRGCSCGTVNKEYLVEKVTISNVYFEEDKGMSKPEVIIYGLGKQWETRKKFLERTFNIIAYSDRKMADIDNYISPEGLCKTQYQYVYITSDKYYDEIKDELIGKYGVDGKKVIGERDAWWYIKNSVTRDKWVIERLKEIPTGKTLLDAGAGELPYKKYCDHLNYISQDFGQYNGLDSSGGVGLAPEEWNTSHVDIVSDIAEIPLEDNAVDAILCTEVFEHIKNPLSALQEFGRICKKGGILLLTAPFCSLTHFAPYYFTNGFSPYWYEENLRDFGFKLVEMTSNGNYFDYLRQELLRLPNVARKYCVGDALVNDGEDSIINTMMLLERLSKEDKGSSELLCFGYMIKAMKA